MVWHHHENQGIDGSGFVESAQVRDHDSTDAEVSEERSTIFGDRGDYVGLTGDGDSAFPEGGLAGRFGKALLAHLSSCFI